MAVTPQAVRGTAIITALPETLSTAPRARVTPADVRESALALFAERGYHGTALSQVAERLGIRTPSLYNHMESKQQLLQEILVDTTDGVMDDFLAAIAAEADVTERLRRAVEAYALRHAHHPREALVVNRDFASLEEPVRSQVLAKRRQHQQSVRDLVAEGNGTGVFDAPEPTLASFAILEMCVSIGRWFQPTGRLAAQAVAARYAEYALGIVKAEP
jgi:AcrR family transcriptional regulator